MHSEDSFVLEDLSARVQANNLLHWIEERAEELSLLGRIANGGIEFSRELRDALGIKAIVPDDIKSRAQISSDDGGFVVRYRRSLTVDAQRFAIAHEFGHTLWFAPGKGTENLTSATVGQGDHVIEALCDYFASALLVPHTAVSNACRSARATGGAFAAPALGLVPQLATTFRVTERVAAWRLLDVGNYPSLAIVSARKTSVCCQPSFAAVEKSSSEKEGNRSKWSCRWYAIGGLFPKVRTVEGYSVPFDTRRIIPQEMIPRTVGTDSRFCDLDSRWWTGVRAQPSKEASRPLQQRLSGPKRVGQILRNGDTLYVTLPIKG